MVSRALVNGTHILQEAAGLPRRLSVLKCFWRQHRGSKAFFLFLGSDYKLTEQCPFCPFRNRTGKHAFCIQVHTGAHWGWLFRYRRASYGWDICSKKFPAASTARSVAIKTCPGSRKCRILGTVSLSANVFGTIIFQYFPRKGVATVCPKLYTGVATGWLDSWTGTAGMQHRSPQACKFTCPLLEVSLVNELPCICLFLIQKNDISVIM